MDVRRTCASASASLLVAMACDWEALALVIVTEAAVGVGEALLAAISVPAASEHTADDDGGQTSGSESNRCRRDIVSTLGGTNAVPESGTESELPSRAFSYGGRSPSCRLFRSASNSARSSGGRNERTSDTSSDVTAGRPTSNGCGSSICETEFNLDDKRALDKKRFLETSAQLLLLLAAPTSRGKLYAKKALD